MPYLNSAPFFRGLALGERFALADLVPREQGLKASSGEIAAGLLPIVDFFRLEETFERIGRFGIAVRGRARSVLLFSRKPIRQLEGCTIAVTEETSTSAVLLRLLLEQRYRITPASYVRGQHVDADAQLLIGDEALRFQHANARYPYEIDVAFEWWLWQHLPFVFAVWAIRKDASPQDKKQVEMALIKSLGGNMGQMELIAQEHASGLGVPAAELQTYLASFIYRLSQPEEEGIKRFRAFVEQCGLISAERT